MEWYQYILVVLVGLMAGFLNTLAGGGSALSFPFLIFLGLPVHLANGTNRIAILLQNAVGIIGFSRSGTMDYQRGWKLAIPSLLGAVLGAFTSVKLNEQIMRYMVGGVLLIILMVVVFKPDIWIHKRSASVHSSHRWVSPILFFGMGLYGGFIQIGTGFFLLAGLVLSERLSLLKANALKVFIILTYTPLALLVFVWNGQVNYGLGLVLALGNMLGAWLATRVAVSRGARFMRWMLIGALCISISKLFGLF